MPKTPRADLWQHLLEQLEFLRASAQAFDEGRYSEAKRLAGTTRTLVHDTGRSASLLRQLKLLPGMAFWSTTRHPRIKPHVGELDPGAHIVHLEVSEKGVRYYAPGSYKDEVLDLRVPRLLFFPDWWNEVVITSKTGAKFSRRVVVTALANKLGGTHVDPELSPELNELINHNPTGARYRIGEGQETMPVKEVELHTMRQIAHEVLLSIDRKLRA